MKNVTYFWFLPQVIVILQRLPLPQLHPLMPPPMRPPMHPLIALLMPQPMPPQLQPQPVPLGTAQFQSGSAMAGVMTKQTLLHATGMEETAATIQGEGGGNIAVIACAWIRASKSARTLPDGRGFVIDRRTREGATRSG